VAVGDDKAQRGTPRRWRAGHLHHAKDHGERARKQRRLAHERRALQDRDCLETCARRVQLRRHERSGHRAVRKTQRTAGTALLGTAHAIATRESSKAAATANLAGGATPVGASDVISYLSAVQSVR